MLNISTGVSPSPCDNAQEWYSSIPGMGLRRHCFYVYHPVAWLRNILHTSKTDASARSPEFVDAGLIRARPPAAPSSQHSRPDSLAGPMHPSLTVIVPTARICSKVAYCATETCDAVPTGLRRQRVEDMTASNITSVLCPLHSLAQNNAMAVYAIHPALAPALAQ
jgi:hypothetical protein